jgi:hypothetical protein
MTDLELRHKVEKLGHRPMHEGCLRATRWPRHKELRQRSTCRDRHWPKTATSTRREAGAATADTRGVSITKEHKAWEETHVRAMRMLSADLINHFPFLIIFYTFSHIFKFVILFCVWDIHFYLSLILKSMYFCSYFFFSILVLSYIFYFRMHLCIFYGHAWSTSRLRFS